MNLDPNWRAAFVSSRTNGPPPMPAFAKVDEALLPQPVKPPRQVRRRELPTSRPLTSLEREVLEYAAWYKAVTTFQVIRKFWVARGKSSRHGNRLLRALADRGLLSIHPLYPYHGRSSIRVCTLTRQGWAALGEVHPPKDATATVGRLLLYRLQYAEMMQIREAEGWTAITPEDLAVALRRRGLDQYKGRVLTGEQQALNSLLAKLPEPRMPCSGLRHKSGGLRMLLAAHNLRRTRSNLQTLPSNLGVYGPELEVEIVASGHLERDKAQRLLLVTGNNLRLKLTPFHCPFFSER